MTRKRQTPQTVEDLVGIAKWLAFKAWTKQVASRGAYLAIEREELEGAALLGLAEAISRFDPSRGVLLGTYAPSRIRGAIQDAIRKSDMLGQEFRGRRGGGTGKGKPKGQSSPRQNTAVLVPLDERIALGLRQDGDSPLDKVLSDEEKARVQHYLETLPPRFQQLLRKYFWENKSCRKIAEEIGLCEDYVYRLLKRACTSFHNAIRRDIYQ